MTDEFTLHQATVRAQKAKTLLEDPILVAAWDEIERDLVNGWINSDPRDTDGRERLWAAVQANRKVKDAIHKHVQSGSLAQKELERIFAAQERQKKLGKI